MVAVYHGGSRELDMMLSGEPHPNTLQYLKGQMDSLRGYVGNAASEWYTRAANMYEQYSSDTAMRYARAAIQKVQSVFQPDLIYEFSKLQEFRSAPPMMQRYLLTHVEMRQMYHNQQMDGWSDTYHDAEPSSIGVDHTDWRRVNTGIVQMIEPTEADPDGGWKVQTWFDDPVEGERRLTLGEQVSIISSQNSMWSIMVESMEDASNKAGGVL